jgi:hypothetical protein
LQVYAVLAKQGVSVPTTDLFGVYGSELLETCRLATAYRTRVESLRDLIEVFDAEITKLETDVCHELRGHAVYTLADQPVVTVRLLLTGVGAERRGWLIGTVRSTGARFREEARRTCQLRKQSRSTSQSSRCGQRTGGLRPTRVPRESTRSPSRTSSPI